MVILKKTVTHNSNFHKTSDFESTNRSQKYSVNIEKSDFEKLVTHTAFEITIVIS